MGRTVLALNDEGQVDPEGGHGLFVHETRLLSRLQYLIDGEPPRVVASSNVAQHSWLGYYVAKPGDAPPVQDQGSGQMSAVSERPIELRVSRSVGDGMHEDIDVINWTRHTTSLELTIALAADFADVDETRSGRKQRGSIRRSWTRAENGGRLTFSYTAQHHFEHQGDHGTSRIDRELIVRVADPGSPPTCRRNGLRFKITIGPHESWHTCLLFGVSMEGQELQPAAACYGFGLDGGKHADRRAVFVRGSKATVCRGATGRDGTRPRDGSVRRCGRRCALCGGARDLEDLRAPVASALMEIYEGALADAEMVDAIAAILSVEMGELSPQR